MVRILPSYVCDEWRMPDPSAFGTPTVLRDATTGEPVAAVAGAAGGATDRAGAGEDAARADAGAVGPDVAGGTFAGPDVAAALAHARTVGQRSLGALTFHQRALLLKSFAQALTARTQELYDLSACAGATLRDAQVDVDGGIGVLFTYSSKGRRELPNAQVIVDGPPEQLSKDGSFLGRHIYTRLPGVAVQINAFNFPVWGALEKFAPAFLAGVPTVVKPATPTAYIAEAWVRILVDSGLLPSGALQLVVGPVPDLFDHLRVGDAVGFTGSAATAARVRASMPDGVRFTAETDSLNASVLGPDATVGTTEFDAYIAQLVVELTSKAGQKCTAIRRAIVPEEMKDAVVHAVRARIADRVVMGDPRAEGVTLGPLVSLAQRDDVLAQVARLRDAGGHLLLGDLPASDALAVRHVGVGAPDGAFVAPILLGFDEPRTPAVHEIEAFGPVASVLTYRTADEAARLVNLGGGSLVTSVATGDAEFAAALTAAIAPYNGRVLVMSAENTRTSTGHGAPVPHLVHGGPGRAGGGEELGGIRAVTHYMQRTALQGSPTMLTRLTGIWHEGAETRGDRHPFRLSLAELRLGDRFDSAARQVTLDDIETFAHFTGDTFYAHMDEQAAAANPFFPGRVAHGYLLVSFAAGLFVDPDPGPVLANYGLENLRFVTPVSPDDEIRVSLTAKQITPRETDDYGEVRWDAVIRNQRDELVATYDVLTLVAKSAAAAMDDATAASTAGVAS